MKHQQQISTRIKASPAFAVCVILLKMSDVKHIFLDYGYINNATKTRFIRGLINENKIDKINKMSNLQFERSNKKIPSSLLLLFKLLYNSILRIIIYLLRSNCGLDCGK